MSNKQEKLQRVLEQIAKENLVVAQSKEKIKALKKQKMKLEQQIREEESEQLMNVLADYGIKNIDDFEKFIDGNDFAASGKSAQPTDE